MSLFSHFSFLLALLSCLTPALCDFSYIDKTCSLAPGGVAGFASAQAEALTAVNKAISSMQAPRSGRVTRMLIVSLGIPATGEDRDTILNSFAGSYKALAAALAPGSPNGIYVYCGPDVLWSSKCPDPSKKNAAGQFDPTNPNNPNTAVSGVQCDASANMGLGGYIYAPDPSGNLPYVQVTGVAPFEKIDGKALCDSGQAAAFTALARDTSTGQRPNKNGIVVFCDESFPGGKGWPASFTNDNSNNQYYQNPGDDAATLNNHKLSLSANIIHEMGHALEIADDQIVNGGKAYAYSGVVALSQQCTGKSAGSNNCWQNCDTLALYALAMLMDACEWCGDVAAQPGKWSPL